MLMKITKLALRPSPNFIFSKFSKSKPGYSTNTYPFVIGGLKNVDYKMYDAAYNWI